MTSGPAGEKCKSLPSNCLFPIMTPRAVRGLVIIGVAILQILAFQYDWIPVLFAIWTIIIVAVLWAVGVWAKRQR